MHYLEVTNQLGEGILWDVDNQLVWWTDILSSKMYSYHPETQALKHWDTPYRLCSFALYRPQNKQFIAAFDCGIALYAPESGELEWLFELNDPSLRFNDGRCDRQGRFWAGTMHDSDPEAHPEGSLYCLHKRANAEAAINHLHIPNSLCWSPDGKTMYFADSAEGSIRAYDIEPDGFDPEGRIFARLPEGMEPDGSTVAADGSVWNAQWGGSRVVAYNQDGVEQQVIPLPVSQPSCVAIGGKDLSTLFVTSARMGLSEQALLEQPLAGSLFIVELEDVIGLLEPLADYSL